MSSSGIAPSQQELIALRVQAGTWRTTALAAHGPRAGERRGPSLGRGLDFAEVRPYQPGDDLRNMDWRHTARRGRPFTKLFHEEREQPVLLFVDLGATMRFGTRRMFKSVAAARAAALLAWAAVDAGDRVGGVVHDGRNHQEQPPSGRDRGALALIHRLVAASGAGVATREAGAFARAIQSFARGARPGSHCILLSDFHSLDAEGERALHALRGASAIGLVQVFDALESTAPPPGIYRISAQDGQRTLDLRDDVAREAYGRAFRERTERLASLARHLRAIHLPLATHDDPRNVLAKLWQPMAGRA